MLRSLWFPSQQADGPVTLLLDDQSRLEADEVLAAAGRAPRTSDLGLGTVGLKDGSWLNVDDTCRVQGIDGGWLYAAGDVNHLALLTHIGKYQGRVCGDAIAARALGKDATVTAWASRSAVPQVIFTVPEVAAVGLTAAQAQAAGRNVRAVDYDIGRVRGAQLFADGYAGRARMVVDEDSKVIVGMTLAGPGVGEMIHAATIAVAGQVPLDLLCTPCRHTRPSAKCGSGYLRRTAYDPVQPRLLRHRRNDRGSRRRLLTPTLARMRSRVSLPATIDLRELSPDGCGMQLVVRPQRLCDGLTRPWAGS